MDKANKIRIINELCDNLKADMLTSVEALPKEWDGIELRMLMELIVTKSYNYYEPPHCRRVAFWNYVNTHSLW